MSLLPWAGRRPSGGRLSRRAVFARLPDKPLDLLKPPPYELSARRQQDDRAQVEGLIDSLKPNGLDANSREVLFNLVNALAEQALAELDAERDERHAIGRVLVGMASEELTRRRHRFDADATAAHHAAAALALAYEAMTGRNASEYLPAGPTGTTWERLESGVGAIDLRLDDPPRRTCPIEWSFCWWQD
jgi:hypothetical protein